MTTGYAGARVAVLGASGFIGRWVARKLVDAGACVCLTARDVSQINAPPLGEVIAADLTDREALESIYSGFRPSIVFNLAGYGVDPAQRNETLAQRINADLPGMLCQCASRWRNLDWRGMDVVHAGSAAEYGNAGGDLREDGPAQPFTVYGRTKLAGSQQLAEGCARFGVRGVTARLFTVYGPGEGSWRLLPSLVEASRTGQRIGLSAGLQRRDFTYVEDVSDGLLRLGLLPAGGGAVNLATGRLTTVRSFVETAANALKIPSFRLKFGELPANLHEMEHESVSVARLRGLLGWVPGTSVVEGIRRTLEFRP